MRLQLSLLPDEMITHYKLKDIADDGYVYCKIQRGMYGLAKAGILDNKLLSSRLEQEGYYQFKFTPSLWCHTWRPITFTLVVDSFGVKFEGDCHANHLKKCLEKHYKVSIDWCGSLFCGIHLDWNYKKGYVNNSMPGYIDKARHKYQHPMPKRPVNAPAKFKPIEYGAKVQTADVETLPRLEKYHIRHIQDVFGMLLYYSRAVDTTLLATLSQIASRQSTATEEVAAMIKQLLNYVATHSNAGYAIFQVI